MQMSPRDWQRLARYVRERRDELGLTQEEIATRGGPSTATLRLIETGTQDSYRAKSLRQLAEALRWTPESPRAILAGREPEEVQESGRERPATETTPPEPEPGESADHADASAIGILTESLLPSVRAAVRRARMRDPDAKGADIFEDRHQAALWDLALPEPRRLALIAFLQAKRAQEEVEESSPYPRSVR